MHVFSMVSTSKGLLILGGRGRVYRGGELIRHSKILQLDCQDAIIQNCEWNPIAQEMEVARSSHIVIPLPESYDICIEPDYPDAEEVKQCTDNTNFARCDLIVNAKYCNKNAFYAKFCCASCVQDGQLGPDGEMLNQPEETELNE